MGSESRTWEIRPFGSMRGGEELVIGPCASQSILPRLLYCRSSMNGKGRRAHFKKVIFTEKHFPWALFSTKEFRELVGPGMHGRVPSVIGVVASPRRLVPNGCRLKAC